MRGALVNDAQDVAAKCGRLPACPATARFCLVSSCRPRYFVAPGTTIIMLFG
jgi:hypothetical protein